MSDTGQLSLFDVPISRSPADREPVNLVLWLVEETPMAACFLVEAEERARRVWVPRSLMSERVDPRKEPGCAWERWEFTLPRWKVRELGLEGPAES